MGAEQRNGRGVGCLEPSVNSWEVWFHRLAPPCQGPDWAGQEAQERPGLLKDTNRWEAALEGGAPGGIEKADLQGLLWAQSTGQIQRRMVDRRIAEVKRGEGQEEVGFSGSWGVVWDEFWLLLGGKGSFRDKEKGWSKIMSFLRCFWS